MAEIATMHYSDQAGHAEPMDIEWVKDGVTGELFVVQARPETVHSAKQRAAAAEVYRLTGENGAPLVTGQAVGERIGRGRVRIVQDASELQKVESGDVLEAKITDPDWEPVMRRVAAVITNQGLRLSHTSSMNATIQCAR